MMPLHARLLAAAAMLALPAAAPAHRQWLLPSATIVSGTDSWVTVDAAVSNDLFFFDHQPMRLETIKVWAPDGSAGAIQNGATGRYRATFDVRLDRAGTWKIGTIGTNVTGSVRIDGVERRVGGRGGPPGGGFGAPAAGMAPPGPPRLPPIALADIPAGATDLKLAENSTRNEIFVTAGAPTAIVFKPTGKGLEMEPLTHPDELVAGETASFRFLIDGQPAPGLSVTVIPGGKRYRNDEGAVALKTGADGVVKVDWPTAGLYWLNATASDTHPSEPRATERRMSYAATLEVLTP